MLENILNSDRKVLYKYLNDAYEMYKKNININYYLNKFSILKLT